MTIKKAPCLWLTPSWASPGRKCLSPPTGRFCAALSSLMPTVSRARGYPVTCRPQAHPPRVGGSLSALPRRARGPPHLLWASGTRFLLWVFHAASTQQHSASCLLGLRHQSRKLHNRPLWPPSTQMAYGWFSSLPRFGFRLWSRLLSSASGSAWWVCVCVCVYMFMREHRTGVQA